MNRKYKRYLKTNGIYNTRKKKKSMRKYMRVEFYIEEYDRLTHNWNIVKQYTTYITFTNKHRLKETINLKFKFFTNHGYDTTIRRIHHARIYEDDKRIGTQCVPNEYFKYAYAWERAFEKRRSQYCIY